MKSNLSDDEHLLFYQKLQQRYNEELETMKQLVPFNLISNAGIKLITKNTPLEIHKYSWEKINSNQIVFYCRNGRNKTKELLRHLRNCIAHSNINRHVINNEPHYKFEDMYWAKKGVATYTLKGYIKQDDWEQFVDFIYTESKKPSLPQSSQIIVKGKSQL